MEEQHSHRHSAAHLKSISNRLAKIIGHLESVKKMVENDKDCSEILIQLAAVKGAVNNTANAILKEHLSHCFIHALEDGNRQMIEDLQKAIDMFVK